MEFKLTLFEYKKNCKEYRVLKKATDKNATRQEISEGKNLFGLIFKNIVIIDKKLFEIENSIINRNVEITGSIEKEKINPHNFKLKTEFDNKLENSYADEMSYYRFIQPYFDHIWSYLDPEFNHYEYDAETNEIERKIKKGEASFIEKISQPNRKRDISNSIENSLKYYSKTSNKLERYYKLFIEL